MLIYYKNMDIEIVDIEKHRNICAELDKLEKTIENTKYEDERIKLFEQANKLIDKLQETESESKKNENNGSNGNNLFTTALNMVGNALFGNANNIVNNPNHVAAFNVHNFQYYTATSKVKYYRDSFDRFKKPKKSIL
tara:strand:- start:182 stop:592 length:411 start_codon:yes stop_codon:yes gene_type:complete